MNDKMLDAALEYAARGWPVFPVDQLKQPFPRTRGVLDATTDPSLIEEFWAAHPHANIALDVGGAGMMVLDLDPGHDWDEIEDSIGDVPDTKLVATTPRGGEHLYFALEGDEIVAPSASKLAPNVDVRSFHSYVLLPPSKTPDGDYKWGGSPKAKPAFRTDEMVRVANTAREKHEDRDEWKIDPDLPENVAAATRWLKKEARIATEGNGGDHEAYATGAHMKSFGISEETAFELIWEHWNPRCRPPWDDHEEDHLRRKIQNAYRYNTSPPGNITDAYHKAKAKEMFKPVVKKTERGYEARGKYHVVTRAAMQYFEPPEWLLEDTLHCGEFGVIYGPPGTYKTFTALDMAFCIATGGARASAKKDKVRRADGKRTKKREAAEEYPRNWHPNKEGKVLFCAGESPLSFQARARAWELIYNGGQEVDDFNFTMVSPVPPAMEPSEWDLFLEEVLAACEAGGSYDLIIIDTAARSMAGGDENSSKDMGLFIRLADTLIRETGAAVLVIHHTNKQGAMRGSDVLLGAVDTQIRIEEEDGLQIATMEKQRNAAKWEQSRGLRASTVELGEGETSVAMLHAGSQDRKTDDGKRATKKKGNAKAFEPVKNVVSMEVIDGIICDILKDNPLKDWTNTALAQAVAMDERCAYSSASLTRNRPGLNLMTIREDKERRANTLYDPSTKKWRWKKEG